MRYPSEVENDEAAPKRRSPADAFDELTATVNRSAGEIAELFEYSRKVKDKLLVAADIHRVEGMWPILESMIQIQQTLFTRVQAAGSSEEEVSDDAAFVSELLITVEEEMRRHSIRLIKPVSGSTFDPHTMECSNTVLESRRIGAPPKFKAGTVASVSRCGFIYNSPSGEPRLVARAQVQVFASLEQEI